MYQLDSIDKKILFELDLNSRTSDSQIAKKLKISRDVVRYRISKLIGEEYIHYFMTIINSMKLGFNWYRTFFKFENLNPKIENEIITYLQNKSSWITKVEGRWDLNTGIFIKNVYEFKDFMDDFLLKFSSFIKEYEVSIVTKMYVHHKNYLLTKKQDYEKPVLMGFESFDNFEAIKIDETDYNILKSILKDARKKTIDIAREINSSEIVVRTRLKKLIKNGVILGFRPFLNIDKLGYIYFKLHLNLHNLSIESKRRVLFYLHNHANVAYTTELVNGSDLEIEFQVKSNNEFYDEIEILKKNFSEIIKSYDFMQYTKEYKFTYLPELF